MKKLFRFEEEKESSSAPLVVMGAVVGAAALYSVYKFNKKEFHRGKFVGESHVSRRRGQIYFVGGGLSSLAGAAYLIRDCRVKGENIHILEGLKVLGGSNDGAGNPAKGFVCSGDRRLNEETYENFWELFADIPSIDMPGWSVTQEILNFDHLHPTHAQARLIDGNGVIQDSYSMGFNLKERLALGELMMTDESCLQELTIEDWFVETPHFFKTNFWIMWQSTFTFQRNSSLSEFKRYLERLILEYSRLHTLSGVTHTPYNQYDSVIVPLKKYLKSHGVDFQVSNKVTDIDFKEGLGITATAIHIQEGDGTYRVIELNEGDGCFVTNGCMTDNTTHGDFNRPPKYKIENPMSGELWRKLAAKKPGLGNPEAFFGNPQQTTWESFTVTCRGNLLLKLLEQLSGNIPGSGGLITFKDSPWLMSISVPVQPHFKNQAMDETVFWGYGLHVEVEGEYVKKPMKDCTGEEILIELLHQLHLENKQEEILDTIVNVIPSIMPYIASPFQPHKIGDRPQVVPEGSTNFAVIGQFVEIPEDIVFTEEYSVRSARTAVYKLMRVKNKRVSPVSHYNKELEVLLKALKTSFRK